MEERTIITAHVAEAVSDETACAVLQFAVFPVALSVAAKAEQRFGDGAIAGAREMRVERPQNQNMTIARLLRQGANPWTGGTPVDCSPEAQHSFRPQLEKGIEWQENSIGYGAFGRCGIEPNTMLVVEGLPVTMPDSILVEHLD